MNELKEIIADLSEQMNIPVENRIEMSYDEARERYGVYKFFCDNEDCYCDKN